MTLTIEGVSVPANEGNLPLVEVRDEDGKLTAVRIAWRGFTIVDQFPWTRPTTPQHRGEPAA